MSILHIDRSKPFNLNSFLGEYWSIEEEDERSLVLTELDLTQVKFVTALLEDGETSIKGEEKLLRLKARPVVRLDAKILQTLLENISQIPEEWKKYDPIYFDGTVLYYPSNDYYVLCLYWDGREWGWDYTNLRVDWRASRPSAVLAN